MSLKRKFPENFTFSQYLLIICILIVAPIMTGLLYDSFRVTSEEYHNNFDILRDNTEQSVIETLKVVNLGLMVYDAGLDSEMKRAFRPFLQAYEDSGGDPSAINLEIIRNDLGERYNLYIIDRNHTVIYSTKEIDIGLNFSYMEDFSIYLDNIREGDSYAGDRVVRGIRDIDTIQKYSYYPTPDHNYVLELSYDIDKNSTRSLLKYGKTVDDLRGMNPYLEYVEIYDMLGYTIGTPEILEKPTKNFIKSNIIEEKQNVVIEDTANGTITDYRYIGLYEPSAGSDPSLAISFTYSTKRLDDQIFSVWMNEILSTAGLSLLLILVLGLVCIKISRPFSNFVEDVNAIAEGDLDHKIRSGRGGREFVQLERSVSNMVARLKETIKKVRESEDMIKKHNEELEKIVTSRTKEAEEKSEEANFYLDVITHDINNSNMAALGYAEILMEISEESNKNTINNLIVAVRQNAETIKNVSIVRTMKKENRISLHPVEIDDLLRHSASLFQVNTIYGGTDLKVMADSLLEEVFINIIGNCNRHVGPNCTVKINVDETGEMVKICIEDDGPGIPDDHKEECFSRYAKNLSGGKASGKGLGLYIVRTLVTERYGGSLEVLDAAEGPRGKGLRICILLRKA